MIIRQKCILILYLSFAMANTWNKFLMTILLRFCKRITKITSSCYFFFQLPRGYTYSCARTRNQTSVHYKSKRYDALYEYKHCFSGS